MTCWARQPATGEHCAFDPAAWNDHISKPLDVERFVAR